MLLLLCSVSSFANTKKPSKESTVFNETFSWQAQMGFSLHYGEPMLKGVKQSDLMNYLNISLLFDFYYKGFFIQSDHRRADTQRLGAEVGYQLAVENDWEFDIISKSYISGFYPETIMDIADKNIPEIDGIKSRQIGTGLGIRYSRYYDDNYFSLDVANLSPLSDARGWIIDAFYSKLILYRNWDIYVNSGLTLYSPSTVDYYFGVDNNEINAHRAYYQPGAGAKLNFEIFAQQPISESWTFNAGFSQSFYTANITNSPIIDSQGATRIMLGVLYVF